MAEPNRHANTSSHLTLKYATILLAVISLGTLGATRWKGADDAEFRSETLRQQSGEGAGSWGKYTAELVLLHYQASTHAFRPLAARIASRGCAARRSPKRPPVPGFVLVGVMKSGTTDLHFRTNNASWAYGGDRKESHWFETACSGQIGDRLRVMQVGMSPDGAPACPAPPQGVKGGNTAARILPVNPEFPELRSDVYLQGCTGWHFQHFFMGGTYECASKPPFTPSESQAPPMGVWQALHTVPTAVAHTPRTRVEPPEGMWFAGGGRPEFAGWRVSHDASPKLLPMVDGPAAAAATSPLARMVMQFRHPVQRAWSHYFHVRFGNASAEDLTPAAFHRSAQAEVANFKKWGGNVQQAVHGATAALRRLSELARGAAAAALTSNAGGAAAACVSDTKGVLLPLPTACVHAVDTAMGAALHWVQEAGLGVDDGGYAWAVKTHHTQPVAPPGMPAAHVTALQAAVREHLQRPEPAAARSAFRTSLGQVLATWRGVMLGTYEGYDFDNFKQGGTILARGLYAAQTLRLFSLVPPSDVFLSQAEEYYRDPKPVLAALQGWLCVPLESPPCTKGHPFLNSRGGQDVVARPSAPKYAMLPETDAALSGAIAPHMTQHAQLLDVLSGSADSADATACLVHIQQQCVHSTELHACQAHAAVGFVACGGLGVGPLASVALLQGQGGQGAAGMDTLARLQHRWDKTRWNASLLQPGHGLDGVEGGGYLGLLGPHGADGAQGPAHPRGRVAYSRAEVQEATSWASCLAAE